MWFCKESPPVADIASYPKAMALSWAIFMPSPTCRCSSQPYSQSLGILSTCQSEGIESVPFISERALLLAISAPRAGIFGSFSFPVSWLWLTVSTCAPSVLASTVACLSSGVLTHKSQLLLPVVHLEVYEECIERSLSTRFEILTCSSVSWESPFRLVS